MMIALKIVTIYLAVVLALPMEYFLFPKLCREEPDDSEKNYIDDEKETAINLIFGIIVIMILSIAISCCIFFSENYREVWYMHLAPMAFSIFLQFVWACIFLQKKLMPVILPILIIAFIGCIILPSRDWLLVYEPEVSDYYIKKHSELSYDSDEDRYIYERNRGNSEHGVALVDAKNIEFLPCKYGNQISGIIKKHYPKEEIVRLGIEIRESVPYAKFGILKRPHIFSKPEIDYYVLLDMQKGKIYEEGRNKK